MLLVPPKGQVHLTALYIERCSASETTDMRFANGDLQVSTMYVIQNDPFYELIRPYDSDLEYHFVGEVDYHLLKSDMPYAGLRSHREALLVVFERLVQNSIADRKGIQERWGEDIADPLSPLVFDIEKAQAAPLPPKDLFYCPNVVKIDSNGNVCYDAVWSPNDENFGTSVPYWYALMEPVHGRRNRPEDFSRVNEALFPKGTDKLDIFEWTTDWSDLFDAGHEWYGACCWSIYDRSLNRYVVMLVSATD